MSSRFLPPASCLCQRSYDLDVAEVPGCVPPCILLCSHPSIWLYPLHLSPHRRHPPHASCFLSTRVQKLPSLPPLIVLSSLRLLYVSSSLCSVSVRRALTLGRPQTESRSETLSFSTSFFVVLFFVSLDDAFLIALGRSGEPFGEGLTGRSE